MAVEVVRAWLASAAHDLRAIRGCLHGPEPTPTAAAFHCQQAAEKLVKAVLVSAGIHPPRSHDIGALLDLLGESHALYARLLPLARFTPYSWVFRYPAAAPTESAAEPPSAEEVARWLEELRQGMDSVTVAVG